MKHLNKQLNHLVVIRISDSSAMSDLAKKTRETADLHPDIPGAKLLRTLGASPLSDPDKVNGRITTCPGFRAVYFRIPGTNTRVIMALGSATMVNLGEDDNAFVSLLRDVLVETPVHTLWVADFSRLLRSIDYFSHTWRAVREHCQSVRHAGAVIDTSSVSAEIQFLFEALSAAAEARFVVSRTTRGKMRTYVDGKCPLANNTVPLGWTRDKARRVQLDESVPRELVRRIIQVLGDPKLTNKQRVKHVADAGATSTARSRKLGRTVPIDELSNPSEVVGRWYEMLDIWRTGKWVVEYDLPALLNQVQFDYDIDIEMGRRGVRVWTMTFDMPPPDGGWASPDEFDAAVRLRDERSTHDTPQGGASAGTRRKPFCGLRPWRHEGYQFALLSSGQGSYALRRRPEEQATRLEQIGGRTRRVSRGWGRGTDKEGTEVARVSAPELHRTIAEGLVGAATEGLTLRAATDQLLDHDDGVVNQLKTKLRHARQTETNARRSANEAESNSERRAYQRDARAAAQDAEALERDLLRFAGTGGGSKLPVDADAVAVALAAVADQGDHVEGQVADALREVVTDLRILPIDDKTAQWSASLRVPLAGGVLSIGPATGELKLGLERELAARRTKTLAERADQAARLFMADELSVDEVSDELRIATPRRVAQTIRDHLKDRGATASAASALVAWTPPSGRRVVWSRLTDTPYPTDVPQAYAAHVAATYLESDVRAHSSIERTAAMPQAAVTAVLDRGGWVDDADLEALCEDAEVSTTTLGYYINGRMRNGRRSPTYLRRFDNGVGVIPCPHEDCDDGWATEVNHLPEVTRSLICPSCRRMPDPSTARVVFPPEYLAAT